MNNKNIGNQNQSYNQEFDNLKQQTCMHLEFDIIRQCFHDTLSLAALASRNINNGTELSKTYFIT